MTLNFWAVETFNFLESSHSSYLYLQFLATILFFFNLWHFPHLGQRRGVVEAFLSFALFLFLLFSALASLDFKYITDQRPSFVLILLLLFSALASLDFKYITDQRTPTNVHAFLAQIFSHFHLNIS